MERAAHFATLWAGSTLAFVLALGTILGWLVTGPLFGFSDTWQLVMNTFTSIVTFLMVFLIQRSQNKDGMAMQIKLNELLASIQGASNRLINIEELSEDEVRSLHARYQQLALRVRNGHHPTRTMSIEQVLTAATEPTPHPQRDASH
jgi:low affinity Fe/Cu permease